MEMKKKVLGAEHPDTYLSMGNLACTYLNQGRWIEAEQLAVQIMEMRKKVLEAEHPNTLLSMDNLASTYLKQGGRAAGSTSYGNEKEGAWGRTSRHLPQYGKSSNHILE